MHFNLNCSHVIFLLLMLFMHNLGVLTLNQWARVFNQSVWKVLHNVQDNNRSTSKCNPFCMYRGTWVTETMAEMQEAVNMSENLSDPKATSKATTEGEGQLTLH